MNKALNLKVGDDIWLSCRPRNPTVSIGSYYLVVFLTLRLLIRVVPQRSAGQDCRSSIWLRVGVRFCQSIATLGTHYLFAGELTVTEDPHFLWITEFPLFTRDDADKDHLAHGRWSSSHHPFTAPMWQDIDTLYRGEVEKVWISRSACVVCIFVNLLLYVLL